MTAEECVQDMRETVFRETKLTVSAGIAPNKASSCNEYNITNGLTACAWLDAREGTDFDQFYMQYPHGIFQTLDMLRQGQLLSRFVFTFSDMRITDRTNPTGSFSSNLILSLSKVSCTIFLFARFQELAAWMKGYWTRSASRCVAIMS